MSIQVLQGAKKSLEAGRFRVIEFEYHELGPWGQTKLEDVVTSMDGYGFDCYYEASGQVARLTGCWDPSYEMHTWSNVICAHRSDPWRWEIEKYRYGEQIQAVTPQAESKPAPQTQLEQPKALPEAEPKERQDVIKAYPVSGEEITCDTEESTDAAQWFVPNQRANLDFSGLPEDVWTMDLAKLDHNPGKVFINIGMNKGFNLAEFLGMWRPELGVCEKSW